MRILKLAGAALVLVAIISVWIIGDRSRIGELQSLQAPVEETVEAEDPELPSSPGPTGVDITLPQILSIEVEPTNVDTSASSQTLTFTAHVTDDLSGLNYLVLTFSPNTGSTQALNFYVYGDSLISGDMRDGQVQSVIALPKFSAHGRWYLTSVFILDNAMNSCGTRGPNMMSIAQPECDLAIELPYFINGEDSGPIVEPQPVPVETSEPLPPDNGAAADATPWASELRLPALGN